jgi:cytochrome d ubiquinol oxidase subunit I
MAFFLESTFIAVMFFGWNKVSKKFHLVSTWLVAIGSNLSALWILVANGWMQNPAGMKFNPNTARNEMVNFWEVLFNPVAINKFLHTISSGYVLASIFVIGVSAWYLLKNREQQLAKKSIIVASVFGLLTTAFVVLTGDGSARNMAKYQPMKFAAMENLYLGQQNAPLVAIGILKEDSKEALHKKQDFRFVIEIPNMLSYMAFLDPNAYVPGIKDLVHGNPEHNIISFQERSEKGKIAINALADYRSAKKSGNDSLAKRSLTNFEANYDNFGYGYYAGRDVHELIPNISTTFYSFRIMVGLGVHFGALMLVVLLLTLNNKIEKKRFILYTALWSIPLVYIASELGWVVAEVGRQPWVIQDILPTIAAVSQLKSTSVQITFWMFFIIFTGLLIAEIRIMTTSIKKGPSEDITESVNN